MQPIVGVVSDRCMSRYGRRRPFMIIGSIIVAACLLVLGWTREIIEAFVQPGEFAQNCMITLAVFAIYAVDFSINAGELDSNRRRAISNPGSYVVFSKLNSRYASYSEATERGRMDQQNGLLRPLGWIRDWYT